MACSVAILTLSGCSLVPSTWNPFRTPVEKAEKTLEKREEVQAKVLTTVQEEVHKTSKALDKAKSGNPYGLDAAIEHNRTAHQLLDQAIGQPSVDSQRRWQDLIDRQTSLDNKIRSIAAEDVAKRLKEIGKLSEDLQKKDLAVAAANERALQYANTLQEFKDSVMKVAWVIGGLFFLYFLGQILQFLANLNPAFGHAANVVNAVVSPAMHAGFRKARKAAAAALAPSQPNSTP